MHGFVTAAVRHEHPGPHDIGEYQHVVIHRDIGRRTGVGKIAAFDRRRDRARFGIDPSIDIVIGHDQGFPPLIDRHGESARHRHAAWHDRSLRPGRRVDADDGAADRLADIDGVIGPDCQIIQRGLEFSDEVGGAGIGIDVPQLPS